METRNFYRNFDLSELKIPKETLLTTDGVTYKATDEGILSHMQVGLSGISSIKSSIFARFYTFFTHNAEMAEQIVAVNKNVHDNQIEERGIVKVKAKGKKYNR